MSTVSSNSSTASRWKSLGAVLGPLLALLGVIAIFAVADGVFADGTFLTVQNFRTMPIQTCIVAIAALGMTVIIISGGIDLSAGTALALCGTVLAWGIREDVAFRVFHGDSVESASRKMEAAQKQLASVKDPLPGVRESAEAQVQQRRERLVRLLRLKLAAATSATGSDATGAHAAAAKASARLEQRIERLRDPGFRLRVDPLWLENVPNSPWTVPWALTMAIVTGMLAGLLNGALVSRLRVVPFIVTLGTMTIFLGIGNLISNNVPIRPALDQIPPILSNLTRNSPEARFAGFPLGVWLAVGLAIGLAGVLRFTVFGRYVFALGSNESTARLCGINVTLNKILIYGLGGLFFAVAGISQFSRLSSGNPMSGAGLELEIIAAVVIGGGSLSGGRGTVLGTLAGAATMAVINSGCTQLGLADPIRRIVLGVIIISAVTVDQFRQRRLASQ